MQATIIPASTPCTKCGIMVSHINPDKAVCIYCHYPIERAALIEKTRRLYFTHLMMAPRADSSKDKAANKHGRIIKMLDGDADITYGAIWYEDDGSTCSLYVVDELPEETGAVQYSTASLGFWSYPDENWKTLHSLFDNTMDWEEFWNNYTVTERRHEMWQRLNSYKGHESDDDGYEVIIVYDKRQWDSKENSEQRYYAKDHHKDVVFVNGTKGVEWFLKVKRGIPTNWGKKKRTRYTNP